jgi:DNA-binding transcriptional ArsR family regulator
MLNSKVRRKIIRVLCKVGSTNMMNLVRLVNSTYNQVNPSLIALEKEGIIKEERYGRVRMITLERENPKTRLLLQALKILGSENTPTKKLESNPDQGNKNWKTENSTSSDYSVSSFFQEKTMGNNYGSDRCES